MQRTVSSADSQFICLLSTNGGGRISGFLHSSNTLPPSALHLGCSYVLVLAKCNAGMPKYVRDFLVRLSCNVKLR